MACKSRHFYIKFSRKNNKSSNPNLQEHQTLKISKMAVKEEAGNQNANRICEIHQEISLFNSMKNQDSAYSKRKFSSGLLFRLK
jgi:hypothetical protein